jgi:NTP pyrophosphatase (non-canonical NTP hydrolase)
VSTIDDVRQAFNDFTRDRGWSQFHDPKSLILALVGEVGELAELFQWVPAEEALTRAATDPLRTRAAEELADVFIYLSALIARPRCARLTHATRRRHLARCRRAERAAGLRDVDALSALQACAILSISEANHRVLLYRGREHLRTIISKAVTTP